jgi:RNA polymerase sigma-70 factor (ECF subfamily)
MEQKETMIDTRNEPSGFTTVPLKMGPPHNRRSPTTLRTDDDLIQAAKAGNHDAFAELCRRHTRATRQKIMAIVRQQEDAEDAMQETLLRAYLNLGRFRQTCKFSTWIAAIGVNAALAVLRKRKSRRESDIEPSRPDEIGWDPPDQAPDPESRLAEAQITFLLRQGLHDLPPKLQEVMTSYYDYDHSLREAADVLGISHSAAKSRLSRGRHNLKLSLERRGLSGSLL